VTRQRGRIERLRKIDPRVVDLVLAVGLVAGALVDARAVLRHQFDAMTVLSCVVCAGSVAWRRVRPALACVAACGGYVGLAVISGYDSAGVFEWVPVGLTFYTLGRRVDGRNGTLVAASLFAYWLLGAGLIYYVPTSGSVAGVLMLWASALVPYAVGRAFAARSALIAELATQAAQLQREQDLRARRVVVEERNQMARELHDVVAHCVSVMVVQTVAARSVAQGDLEAARNALKVVGSAGREALGELRRMVGALRREGDRLADSAAPGLAELGALVDRARAAGLAVELRVDGSRRELPPGLELVAYRVVQEALTNVIKHAGSATAQVMVSYEDRELRLAVLDTGDGEPEHPNETDSGHGLPGMSERVALYGGELRARPRSDGGFAVRARIPLEGTSAPLRAAPAREPAFGLVALIGCAGRGSIRCLRPLRWSCSSLPC
jgi:signal transduction histidine kinase